MVSSSAEALGYCTGGLLVSEEGGRCREVRMTETEVPAGQNAQRA